MTSFTEHKSTCMHSKSNVFAKKINENETFADLKNLPLFIQVCDSVRGRGKTVSNLITLPSMHMKKPV